jgi:hypothetical protein
MTENEPFSAASPLKPTTPAPMIDHESAPAEMPRDMPHATPRDTPRAARRGGNAGWLFAVLLALLLAGGIEAQYYGLLAPYGVPPPGQGDDREAGGLRQQIQSLAQAQTQMQAGLQAATQASGQVQGLQQQVQALADRIDKLEKAPAVAAPPAQAGPPDLGDLPKRVDDLAAKVATLESQPVPVSAPNATAPQDNAADQQAIAALGQKLDQVQSATKAAIDQVQGQVQTDIQTQMLAGQKQTLEQAEAAGVAQQQAMLIQEKAALDRLSGRIGKLEQGAGSVEDAASRATRLERVQAAVVALQAGESLGEIPDAPPALARFATTKPPTEAALRESFPGLAAHAREVSQPDTAHRSFLQRAFARLQESVTVRQGDEVLVGDPAAGVLADAEVKVQNGDLAGAVTRLHALHGPAATVMAPWIAEAESLMAARAALAALAARG